MRRLFIAVEDYIGNNNGNHNYIGVSRRRRIKVIAGPDLPAVEQAVKEWLQEGHQVKHLQIDFLPQQPACQRWQAIMTYFPNPAAVRPPSRQCRACEEKDACSRYQNYLARR